MKASRDELRYDYGSCDDPSSSKGDYSQTIRKVTGTMITLTNSVIDKLKDSTGLIEASDDGTKAVIVVEAIRDVITEDGGFGVEKTQLKGVLGELKLEGYPNNFTDYWSFVWENASRGNWPMIARSLQEGDELFFEGQFVGGVEITRVKVYRHVGKRGRAADGSKTRKLVGDYTLAATVFVNGDNEPEVI